MKRTQTITEHYCDRCKKKFTPEKYNTHIHGLSYLVFQDRERGDFDFCLKCSDDFYEFMSNDISLQHHKDSTLGLYCIDRNPNEVSHEWIKENAFQLCEEVNHAKDD